MENAEKGTGMYVHEHLRQTNQHNFFLYEKALLNF